MSKSLTPNKDEYGKGWVRPSQTKARSAEVVQACFRCGSKKSFGFVMASDSSVCGQIALGIVFTCNDCARKKG